MNLTCPFYSRDLAKLLSNFCLTVESSRGRLSKVWEVQMQVSPDSVRCWQITLPWKRPRIFQHPSGIFMLLILKWFFFLSWNSHKTFFCSFLFLSIRSLSLKSQAHTHFHFSSYLFLTLLLISLTLSSLTSFSSSEVWDNSNSSCAVPTVRSE